MTSAPSQRRSFAIVGCGAVGLAFGARLHRCGYPTRFLARGNAAALAEHGVVVETPGETIHATDLNVSNDPHDLPACDIVVVCLKTTNNHLLPRMFPDLLTDAGQVILLQNGIGIEQEVVDRIGRDRTMVGVVYIAAARVSPNHVTTSDRGRIVFGRPSADLDTTPPDDALRSVARDFKAAGISVSLTDDLLCAQFQKLVWNIPFGGFAAIHDRLPPELAADPGMRGQIEAIMREIIALAAAAGRAIPEAMIQRTFAATLTMPPHAPSLKQDLDAGHALEIEALISRPLALARQLNVPMPETRSLAARLRDLMTTA